MQTRAAKLFASRQSHFAAQGYHGEEIYKQLAADDELPPSFTSTECAEILNIKQRSVDKQRRRESGPPYVRVNGRRVIYPRPDFCLYLASRFVRTAA